MKRLLFAVKWLALLLLVADTPLVWVVLLSLIVIALPQRAFVEAHKLAFPHIYHRADLTFFKERGYV